MRIVLTAESTKRFNINLLRGRNANEEDNNYRRLSICTP